MYFDKAKEKYALAQPLSRGPGSGGGDFPVHQSPKSTYMPSGRFSKFLFPSNFFHLVSLFLDLTFS